MSPETSAIELLSHYQPIIHPSSHSIFGFEALIRGVEPSCDKLVSPRDLFSRVDGLDAGLQLDRRCRDTIFSQSVSAVRAGTIPLLFINIDLAHVSEIPVSSRFLREQVVAAGLLPEQIAIEIVESRVSNAAILTDFVQIYREAGYLIVLDDFGADHSNLDRILLVRPDIVKIDRNLISGLDTDHYRQAVFQAIVSLAHKIGSLVLAEGVETEAEVRMCSQLGAELQQGYYFARPGPDPAVLAQDLQPRLTEYGYWFSGYQKQMMQNQQVLADRYRQLAHEIAKGLRDFPLEDFDSIAIAFLEWHPELECLYCLDNDGKQISCTLHGSSSLARHPAFHPAVEGTDHSLKPYYLMLRFADFSITETYISFASGKTCRTASIRWQDCRDQEAILCLDFSA